MASPMAWSWCDGTTARMRVPDASPWRAAVQSKTVRGAEFLYTLALASGTRILAVVPSHHDHAIGEAIGIRLEIDHVVAFASARVTA